MVGQAPLSPLAKWTAAGVLCAGVIAVGAERGHAMDVPWVRWAHSEPRGADQERCRHDPRPLQPGVPGITDIAS